MEKSLADKEQANRLCALQQGDLFQMALYSPESKMNRTGHQWLNDAYGAFTPEDKLHRLNKAVETDPTLAEAWSMRGDIYNARGNKTQAGNDYEKAAQAAPKDGAYQRKAARYFFSNKSFAKAVEYYTRLLAINPRDTDAYKDRAYALVQLGRTNEANADLAKVQAIDPNDVYAKNTMSANQYNQQAIAYKQEQDKIAAQKAAASSKGQNNGSTTKTTCAPCKGTGVQTIPGVCKECKGQGTRIFKPDHCNKCGGSGYYGVVRDWSALNKPLISNHVSVLCEACYGIKQKCAPCGGKGGNARVFCSTCKGAGFM
jgi:Tfp pilus assembly protein PilF